MKSIRLFVVAGIFGALAFSSRAQEPSSAPQPTTPKQPASAPAKPPPAKTVKPAAGTQTKNDSKAKTETKAAPESKTETNAEAKQQKHDEDVDKNGDFVPSEQIGADEQVTFPVGI